MFFSMLFFDGHSCSADSRSDELGGKTLKRRAASLTTDQGWDDIAKARVALTPSAK